MPNSLPTLPRHAALFLDLDGTLLDIAPTPDGVVVPPGLAAALAAVRASLGDALAIVTGRPVEQVDALLPGVPFAVAGEHGGAIRHTPGGPLERPALPGVPDAWIEAADRLAEAHDGVLLERKANGFVLHYRLAPTLGPMLQEQVGRLMADTPAVAAQFAVMAAHMAWEIKPRATDKGRAVDALMARAPFTGREPVYVGDDVTDEDGMRAARALNGFGFRVDEVFGDPASVRAWLAGLAPPGGRS